MIKYFAILLSMPFIASANGLTLKEKQKAAHDADAAVIRSDYASFKKNMGKAYNISIGTSLKLNDRYGMIPDIKFGKLLTKREMEYIENYEKSADHLVTYYESDHFKKHQKQRNTAVICGAALFAGSLVKVAQKYSESDVFGYVLAGSIGGGIFGYFLNNFILPLHDSSKYEQAKIIKGVSNMIKEEAAGGLKKDEEKESEVLRKTFEKAQESVFNKITDMQEGVSALKQKIESLLDQIKQQETQKNNAFQESEIGRKMQEIDSLMDGLLDNSTTFDSQKVKNDLKVAKKRLSMMQTSHEVLK